MRHRLAATILAALVLVLAAFTGTSLAGNGHGNGGGNGNGNGNGNGQSDQPAPTQPAAPAAPAAPAQQPAAQPSHGHGHGHGNASKQSDTSPSAPATGGSNANGVKPSSTTKHDTYAKASSDQTKKYGNGKTAGQIATAAGYGSATLHGPGNSQPHKVLCGGHEVDVHALKNKGSRCGESAAQPSAAKPQPEEHKPVTPPATTHTAPPATQQPCAATTQTVTEQVLVGVKHFIGPKGSGRYVVIHPSTHSAHYTGKHPDDVPLYAPVTHTVAVAAAAGCATSSSTSQSQSTQSTSSSTQSTQTQQVAATQTTHTTQVRHTAADTSPAKATPAGGVKGAVVALPASAKPKGGVLGTTTRITATVRSGHLPFTGLPLWIFLAVAAGLLVLGVAVRRSADDRV